MKLQNPRSLSSALLVGALALLLVAASANGHKESVGGHAAAMTNREALPLWRLDDAAVRELLNRNRAGLGAAPSRGGPAYAAQAL